VDLDNTIDASTTFDDGSSFGEEAQEVPVVPLTPTKSPRKLKRTLRHRTARPDMSPSRSVDNESITIQTRHRRINSNVAGQAAALRGMEVPSLVEVDERFVATSPKREGSERDQEELMLRSQYEANKKIVQKKSKEKMVQGAKYAAAAGATVGLAVVTAGVGALGLAILGASAAGGGAALMSTSKEGNLVIACINYEVMKDWKALFDATVATAKVERSTWGQLFSSDGRNARRALLPNSLSRQSSAAAGMDDMAIFRPPVVDARNLLESKVVWKPLIGGWASYLGVQGLRIFTEDTKPSSRNPCSPVKSQAILNTSALDAFLCLMSYGCDPSTGRHDHQLGSEQGFSFHILETVDDNTDIIHMVYRPLFLFPVWTAPRDYVLYRYWRLEPDGTYMVCYDSVEHIACPMRYGYVRGEMRQCFTISPHKKSKSRDGLVSDYECLMTAVMQTNPRGWIPTVKFSLLANQSYADAFGIAALLQLLEIRDAIDVDRFISVDQSQTLPNLSTRSIAQVRSGDSADDLMVNNKSYDFAFAGAEFQCAKSSFANKPRPLDYERWALPDSNSFRVRGKTYLDDKIKVNAGDSIGRLVAVDVVSVDKPIYTGFALHPTERVQLALEKERVSKEKGQPTTLPDFIFMVNICIPGPPFYHAVFYYAVDDRSTIDGSNGTESSKLCNEFFFGDSDEFRHQTFKLIPQIVEGNFIVRKAVGSTPAVLGKKLRQLYVRTDRFCEIILDCGSSSVATGVIRLSLSYAKTLVIDMGFLFEGRGQDTLPEKIFGCVRVKNMDFGPSLRHVDQPPNHGSSSSQ